MAAALIAPLTKETVITWASNSHQYGSTVDGQVNQAFQTEKYAKLVSMHEAGVTVAGIQYKPQTTVAHRPFVNEEAAQEYINFITNLAAKYGVTITSSTIQDYVDAQYAEARANPNVPA
jgi:hypothetical protein